MPTASSQVNTRSTPCGRTYTQPSSVRFVTCTPLPPAVACPPARCVIAAHHATTRSPPPPHPRQVRNPAPDAVRHLLTPRLKRRSDACLHVGRQSPQRLRQRLGGHLRPGLTHSAFDLAHAHPVQAPLSNPASRRDPLLVQ